MFLAVGIALHIAQRSGLRSSGQGCLRSGIFAGLMGIYCLGLTTSSYGQMTAVNSNAIVANLNGAGYLSLPTLNGLGGDLTVEGWIFLKSYSAWARILDLGMGQRDNNILLYFDGTTGTPMFDVYPAGPNANPARRLIATSPIPLNTWTHLAGVVQSDGTMILYVNGVAVVTDTGTSLPLTTNRTSNFIGKSNWSTDPLWMGPLRMCGSGILPAPKQKSRRPCPSVPSPVR